MDELETVRKYVAGVEDRLTTPDPTMLYAELARRHRQRTLAVRVGVALVVALVGIGAFVATRDTTERVATRDEPSSTSENTIDTTTTVEPDAPSLRSVLVDTVAWRPVARSGIPGPAEGSIDSEEVRFLANDDEDRITFFYGCGNVTVRAIEWNDGGFRILGLPSGGTGAEGCAMPEDGAIHRTPVPVGLDVTVTMDYDVRLLTLRSADPLWELTLAGGVSRVDGSASDWADVFLPADVSTDENIENTTTTEPASDSCSGRGAGTTSALIVTDPENPNVASVPGSYATISDAIDSLRSENAYRVPDFIDIEAILQAPTDRSEDTGELKLVDSDGELQFSMLMGFRDNAWFIDNSTYCIPDK